MMNLFSLIKWRSKEGSRIINKFGKRGLVLFIAVVFLVTLLALPLIVYINNYFMPGFEQLADLGEQLKEVSQIDITQVVLSLLSAIVFVILLGSDLPVTISNLFFSDRVAFLRMVPLKPSTIFKAQFLEVFIAGGFPILLFVPIFLAALSGLGMSGAGLVLAALQLMAFVIITLCWAVILSFALVYVLKGRMLKFLSVVMTIVTVFAFVMVLRLMDFSAIDLAEPTRTVERFMGLQATLTHPLMPWSLFVKSVVQRGESLLFFCFQLVGMGLVLEFLGRKVYSSVLDKTCSMGNGTNTVRSLRRISLGRFPAQFFKDYLVLLREPKLTFAVLYPLLFTPVVVSVNPGLLTGMGTLQLLGLVVFLICNYTTVTSMALFAFEQQMGYYSRTLPVSAGSMVTSKVLVVTSLFYLLSFVIMRYLAWRTAVEDTFLNYFLLFLLPTLLSLSFIGGLLQRYFGTGEIRNVFKSVTLAGALVSFLMSTLLPVFSTLTLSLFLVGSLEALLSILNIPATWFYLHLFGLVIPCLLWGTTVVWGYLALCYNDV